MKPLAMPGGQLALVLAWLGGAVLFCAILVFLLHGDAVPRQGLFFAAGWGAVALAFGFTLRRPRAQFARSAATIWLLVGLGAWAWLGWSHNV